MVNLLDSNSMLAIPSPSAGSMVLSVWYFPNCNAALLLFVDIGTSCFALLFLAFKLFIWVCNSEIIWDSFTFSFVILYDKVYSPFITLSPSSEDKSNRNII